eukprot:TRINITY_DN900_c0_g1_i2.p1 TRINITY_DN900_c0_g1~~TRINITY_DN900_c0_g1_i2.p1  ORF type:complete len:149 (-),score=25.46 TRINITY_DN900_c0_g1_i2:447-893(-)
MSDKPKKDKSKKGKKHKRREGRKKKDPNLPKKPLSAFMFFSQDQRAVLKTESPDAKFIEIGKIIGDRWKHLSEEERKPYVELSEKAKEAYNKEKSKLDLTSNKGAKERDPNKPKRPTSSFMFFTQKMRNSIKTEYPNAKGGDVSKTSW